MPTITVSSFKGGTAKTSTSLNLGAALAKFHKQNVLLIDFDAQANLTTGLGYDPDAHDSLATVLQGKKNLRCDPSNLQSTTFSHPSRHLARAR